jgi:hypothetical protein
VTTTLHGVSNSKVPFSVDDLACSLLVCGALSGLDDAGWKRLNLPVALEDALRKELSAASAETSAPPKPSIAAARKDARGGKSKFPKAQMRLPTQSGKAGVSVSTSTAVSGADSDIDFDPRAGSPAQRLAEGDDFNPRVSAGAGSAPKASTSAETDMDSLFGDLPPRSSTITLPGRPSSAGTTVAVPLAGNRIVFDACID